MSRHAAAQPGFLGVADIARHRTARSEPASGHDRVVRGHGAGNGLKPCVTARTTVQPRLSRDILRNNQGKVLLARIKFLLNEQGRPENPEILMTTIPGTEAELQDMIVRWRFDPPMREGQPVRANYILPFRLNL